MFPRLAEIRHSAGRQLSLTAIAIVIFAFFSLEAPQFFTLTTVVETVRAAAFVAIVGSAWTFLLISGELDLSIGAMYAFLMMTLGWLVVTWNLPLWPAYAIVVVVAGTIGLFHGIAVTMIGVPSFILTLGTLSVYQGLALLISGNQPIAVPIDGAPTFLHLATGSLGPIPAQVIWMVVVTAILGLTLKFTRFGYHVYATGGEGVAARQAGINTRAVKTMSFVLVALSVALIGGLTVGWLGTALPSTGSRFNLDVIAAVIIGGASLNGGAGNIYGTVIGALILAMLSSGIVLLGVNPDMNFLVSGGIIVFAGATDVLLRRRLGRAALTRFRLAARRAGPSSAVSIEADL